jgi:hypothetical protein
MEDGGEHGEKAEAVENLAEAREVRARRRQSIHSERLSGSVPVSPDMGAACAA